MTITRLLAAVLAYVTLAASAQDNPVLVGRVSNVTDGDTIKVELSSGPISVRLGSIDAPESKQDGGAEAAKALSGRVLQKEVALEVITQDRYERLVAVVYLGDENINEWMVKQGHAWVYREYAKDPNYCVLEIAARSIKRGLWADPPWIAPWEWRRWQRDKNAKVYDYSDETLADCIAALKKRPKR